MLATNLIVSLVDLRSRIAPQSLRARSMAIMHPRCSTVDDAVVLPSASESSPGLAQVLEMLPTRRKHVSTKDPSKEGRCSRTMDL